MVNGGQCPPYKNSVIATGARCDLKRFLELPNGIHFHDTFARVFAQINPHLFPESLIMIPRPDTAAAIPATAFYGKDGDIF